MQSYPDKFQLNLEKKQFNSLGLSSQATSKSCGFPTCSPQVKLSAGKLEAGAVASRLLSFSAQESCTPVKLRALLEWVDVRCYASCCLENSSNKSDKSTLSGDGSKISLDTRNFKDTV